LILDEYHMLSDEHKDELFDWVHAKLGPTLRVILIGNRIDSKDRQRLEQAKVSSQVRVALIQTRISRRRVEEVMEARGNSERWREAICDWLVASRLVFGEESVSLRLVDTLDEVLRMSDPRPALVELLLHKVPTISRISAAEFVSSYLQHLGLRDQGGVPTSGFTGLCFRIAMLDREKDILCSFVEFLERSPRAYQFPPAARLLAWCVYIMNARDHWDVPLATVWAKRRMFVDQVNFPFELNEEGDGTPSGSGPTFSWSGDPSSLRDLVDAVKRGHSVDWVEVHRKVWSVEYIKDSELFTQLLSSSRNPAMILQHVLPSNLCSLLRLSNTPAATAVQLARVILKFAPQDCEEPVDRPRCLALWTVLLHDRQASTVRDMLDLAGSLTALFEALLWARDWATDRRSTLAPAARTELLQQTLSLVCTQQQAPVAASQAALLWTGAFGQLLLAPSQATELQWAATAEAHGSAVKLAEGGVPQTLPLKRLLEVLLPVADVQEDWVPELQVLWRLGHCRSTAREVCSLWQAAPHLLGASASETGEGPGPPLHEHFIPGVVAAPGTLSRSLQRALLCGGCRVPEAVSPGAFMACCADALNEMRNAEQLKAVRVCGAAGPAIHRLVNDEMAS